MRELDRRNSEPLHPTNEAQVATNVPRLLHEPTSPGDFAPAGSAAELADTRPVTAIGDRLTPAYANVRGIDATLARLEKYRRVQRVLTPLILTTLLAIAWNVITG